MDEKGKATLRLVDRLRGKYVLPVNDGAGLLNGSMTFERQFPIAPIQIEAADALDARDALLKEAADMLQLVYDETELPATGLDNGRHFWGRVDDLITRLRAQAEGGEG